MLSCRERLLEENLVAKANGSECNGCRTRKRYMISHCNSFHWTTWNVERQQPCPRPCEIAKTGAAHVGSRDIVSAAIAETACAQWKFACLASKLNSRGNTYVWIHANPRMKGCGVLGIIVRHEFQYQRELCALRRQFQEIFTIQYECRNQCRGTGIMGVVLGKVCCCRRHLIQRIPRIVLNRGKHDR